MEKEESIFKSHPKASIVAIFTTLFLLFFMLDIILSEPNFRKGIVENKNQYERSFEVKDNENIVKTIKSDGFSYDNLKSGDSVDYVIYEGGITSLNWNSIILH